MVLYTHAVNDRREAAGLPTVNSFWLSGCGRMPATPTGPALAATPTLDNRLRSPALAEDWAAWCDAWRALDAGPIADLQRAGGKGCLTLCGERRAQTWAVQPRSWWQQLSAGWRKPATHNVLEAL